MPLNEFLFTIATYIRFHNILAPKYLLADISKGQMRELINEDWSNVPHNEFLFIIATYNIRFHNILALTIYEEERGKISSVD